MASLKMGSGSWVPIAMVMMKMAMMVRIANSLESSHTISATTNFTFPFFQKSESSTASISDLLLLGDVRIAETQEPHGDVSLQLSGSKPGALGGGVFYHRPVDMLQISSRIPLSFSSSFSCSLSTRTEANLAFVMLPGDTSEQYISACLKEQKSFSNLSLSSGVAITFHVSSAEHSNVEVAIGEVEKRSTCKPSGYGNNKLRWRIWIDYNSECQKLDIRVSGADSEKPNSCFLSYHLDLSKNITGKMYLGFIASPGGDNDGNSLFSWSFQTLRLSKAYGKSVMHSIPIDPSRYKAHSSLGDDEGGGIWGSVIVGLLCVASISLLASVVWVLFIRNAGCNVAENNGNVRQFAYQKLGATLS